MAERYYTVNEVAKEFNLSPYTVRKKIREGEIKAEPGKSDRDGYKIPYSELMRFAQNTGRLALTGAAAGIAAGVVGPAIGGLMASLFAPPLVLGGLLSASVGRFMGKLLIDGVEDGENIEEKRKLTTDSLNAQREAIEYDLKARYGLDALKLSDETLRTMKEEDRKTILAGKAQMKLLESQAKAIELNGLERQGTQ